MNDHVKIYVVMMRNMVNVHVVHVIENDDLIDEPVILNVKLMNVYDHVNDGSVVFAIFGYFFDFG